jgi:hypothetical protein
MKLQNKTYTKSNTSSQETDWPHLVTDPKLSSVCSSGVWFDNASRYIAPILDEELQIPNPAFAKL